MIASTTRPAKKQPYWCWAGLWRVLSVLSPLGLLIELLLLVAVSTVWLLLHPNVATPVIETILRAQGIEANINKITAKFDGHHYQINTQLSAMGKGFSVEKANVLATLSVPDGFAGRAFIQHVRVNDAIATVDINTLQSAMASKDRNRTPTNDWPQYMPKHWALSCSRCDINSGHYHYVGSVSAAGQGMSQATVALLDTNGNDLSVAYRGKNKPLHVSSRQFDLSDISGYPVKLQQLSAHIPLHDWWQTDMQAKVHYAGLDSVLRVKGRGDDRLHIEANTHGETLSLVAQRRDNRVSIETGSIDLSLVNRLKPLLPMLLASSSARVSSEQLASFNAVVASGTVSGKIIVQRDEAGKPYRLQRAETTLNDVSIHDDKHQVSHVSGNVNYERANIDYRLQFNHTVIKLPEAYPNALPQINGYLSGTVNTQQQRVVVDKLALNNNDFDTLTLSGALDFKQTLLLTMKAEVSNLSLNRLTTYFPLQFPPMTKSWLSNALVSGKKNHTSVKISGDLNRFLKDKDFIFKINAKVKDGVLNYLDNNPNIAMQDVNVLIDHRRLSVSVKQANLFSTVNKRVLRVPITGDVVIDNINQAEVVVHANTKPQRLSTLIAFAERSIAKKTVKKVQQIVKADGTFALALNVWLDVHSEQGKETVDVRLSSKDATATLKAYPTLTIKQASADVHANEDGLQRLILSGKVLQQPIHIEINPLLRQKKADGYDIGIQVKRANPVQLLPHVKLLSQAQAQVLKRFGVVKGNSDYDIALQLTATGDLITATVTSTLAHTQLAVFDMLSKKSSTHMPLTLTYDQATRRLQVSLGQRVEVKMALDQQGRMQGLVLDNQQSHYQLKKGMGKIAWQSNAFNYPRFSAFQKAWGKATKATTKHTLDYQLNVTVEAFTLNDEVTEPLQIKGSFDDLHLTSPILSGTLRYRDNHLQAHFSRVDVLELFHLAAKDGVNPEGREVTTFDFANALPTMNITADQLIYRGNNVGHASIHTSIELGNYSIDQILINGEHYYFSASGYETKEPQGAVTKIQIDFKGEKVRDTIALFHLNDVLDAKFLDVSLNLSWPGKAHTLNLRQSYGNAKVNAQNLQMVTVESGVGSLFGLMDIAGILRRVALDFKNLNSAKISFDTLQGRWNIGGGRAMTRDAYAVGSVIDLKLAGAVDLHRRVFDDMALTVIPKASNIIPIIGAVAGGVAGAAVGVVVQQALGDGINQVVGLPYVIAGKWGNPTITYHDTRD